MATTYTLKGMTCDGCKRTVESVLKNVDGVRSAEASVENSTVTVDANENVSFDDLKNALSIFSQYQIENRNEPA